LISGQELVFPSSINDSIGSSSDVQIKSVDYITVLNQCYFLDLDILWLYKKRGKKETGTKLSKIRAGQA
jgi:hypothetical protein